jgi:hypothetical protein
MGGPSFSVGGPSFSASCRGEQRATSEGGQGQLIFRDMPNSDTTRWREGSGGRPLVFARSRSSIELGSDQIPAFRGDGSATPGAASAEI